jgi:alkylated DNA repair dioxygenase AlkB
MDLPIKYISPSLSPAEDDSTFFRLWNELDWLRLPGAPRREYFCNTKGVSYTYGTPPHDRTYAPQVWHPLLTQARREAESLTGVPLEALFLNGYEGERDHLGWHSDDSPEMDPTRPIVVMTYGAEREIQFRPRPQPFCPNCKGTKHHPDFGEFGGPPCPVCRGTGRDDPGHVALTLEHGSILIMKPGMQQTHQHRIPKAGFRCGPRISLTFRGLV